MTKSDYEVGYGRPPRHSQFKPGESGNSGGRRKGSRSFKDRLKEELEQLVTVVENGNQIRVSKLDLMIKGAINAGAIGKVEAIKLVLNLMNSHGLTKEDAFTMDTSDEVLVALIDRSQRLLDIRAKSHLYLEIQPFRSLHFTRRLAIEKLLAESRSDRNDE